VLSREGDVGAWVLLYYVLARLTEKVTRNSGEKKLKGAVFLDVAKALTLFGFLYKPTILNFLPYLVKPISSYLQGRMFEASFLTTTYLVVA
jgi:hypothetical protein